MSVNDLSSPGPNWSVPMTFRLSESTRPTAAQCRCGTRIPAGDRYLEAHPAAEPLRGILGDLPFCSVHCLRAYVRETMEMLDGATSPNSQEICSDLRELVLDLEEIYATLQRVRPPPSRTY